MINGTLYDKGALRQILTDALNFQRYHNLPTLYVGEFSVVNWAPGASGANYFRDLLEIFEEYGWGWAYHSYREEWIGFSAEYTCPDNTTTGCTEGESDRLTLMRSYFAKGRSIEMIYPLLLPE
jgi:hypothetical protein